MKQETTWGSRNAEDLYTIATKFANFDPIELMLEITRQQGRRQANVNVAIVLKAMGVISEK